MFGEERKAKILEFVTQHARVTVQEISAQFGVSESTVRRDLQELEEAKLLRRTHGGAVSLKVVNHEPTFGEKEDAYHREKEAIAERALQMIEEGDTIFIDGGTTTYELVKRLKKFNKLTVVTNSWVFPQELLNAPGIEVTLVGGLFRRETLVFVGPITEQSMEMVRVDKAFVGINALHVKHGLTTPNLIEAATKRKMYEIAEEVILLCDSSKFGNVTFAKVADLTEIDKLITDSGVCESVLSELARAEVDTYIEKPQEVLR
ncbi:DeoR/GlpR family DNA-binding transcription regulator [Tumebacillus permanentifrigoris]|uniref:DeoR family transcriptional regulator n=1 Tax=Tumebacillus permanentifrigoris TaxID=378543 RepID=A0A316D3X8_9BACL|nr:DeoR/GlpR family DNA-binding transcription regulator [Tumebacillus permanentifrigoris]PWK06656.1 DeoR family transcriptional regulator [Tumebacillus permanentifrigoris]